jgi:hypothetical protein
VFDRRPHLFDDGGGVIAENVQGHSRFTVVEVRARDQRCRLTAGFSAGPLELVDCR